jgi:hypothetical protein
MKRWVTVVGKNSCQKNIFKKLLVRQGLPDDMFSYQNANLGKFWSALELVYFMVIWNIIRPFGIFCGHVMKLEVICAYFYQFWCVWTRAIWQPWVKLNWRHQGHCRPFVLSITNVIFYDVSLNARKTRKRIPSFT